MSLAVKRAESWINELLALVSIFYVGMVSEECSIESSVLRAGVTVSSSSSTRLTNGIPLDQ